MPNQNFPAIKTTFLNAYTAHSDAIFRHCYFRLFNRERAKELTQDTFMRTWEQLMKGVEIRNIKAFLYRIATNLIIDETRKKKTDSLDALQEHGFNPAVTEQNKLIDYLEVAKIKKILDQLDSKYRDAITLRYLQDLSIKEISQVLGRSQNVISVRLHRGLKEIKKLL